MLGTCFAAGATCTMADIGRSAVVPGANDNLGAVGVIVALAHSLAANPPADDWDGVWNLTEK